MPIDGQIISDSNGERHRYYSELNQWIDIGKVITSQLVNYQQNGLINPAVKALLETIQIPVNFKIFNNTNVYYYLLNSSGKAFAINIESSDIRIELNRAALAYALMRFICPGGKGLVGPTGINGTDGLPGAMEHSFIPQIDGNKLSLAIKVEAPIDTLISFRLYKSNYYVEILYNIFTKQWEINTSSQHILLEYSSITYVDGIFNAVITTEENWGDGWLAKIRQVGPDGWVGNDGNSFIEINKYDIYGPTIQQYIATLRNINDDLYYVSEKLGDGPTARLRPTASGIYTSIDTVAAVEPSVDSNKGIRKWVFSATITSNNIDLPIWVPNPACVDVDFPWYQSVNNLATTFVESEHLKRQCCQEEFFFCPNLGDACN